PRVAGDDAQGRATAGGGRRVVARDSVRGSATCARAARSGAEPVVKVWLAGRLVEEADACIPPSDRGFLLGDGVFETLRCYSGKPFALAEHLERLVEGARAIEIEAPPTDQLERGAIAVVRASGLDEARMRITLT